MGLVRKNHGDKECRCSRGDEIFAESCALPKGVASLSNIQELHPCSVMLINNVDTSRQIVHGSYGGGGCVYKRSKMYVAVYWMWRRHFACDSCALRNRKADGSLERSLDNPGCPISPCLTPLAGV